MPYQRLDFKPGINKELTSYAGEGGWFDSDKIRFRSGRPEKIGGWEKYNGATTTGDIEGVPIAMLAWRQNNALINVAIATEQKVYIEQGGTYYDVTPVRSTVNNLGSPTGPFTTTSGSKVITVTHTAHGAVNNDYVTISGSAAVGGIPAVEINIEHQLTYVDANSYTITVATTDATSATTGGGGSVTTEYQINTGSVDGFYGLGWGASTWGSSTWGSARSSSAVALHPRTWSLALWGEDIVFCHREGAAYVWDASGGTSSRATAVSGAPSTTDHLIVTNPDRHLVLFGATLVGSQNKLEITWCTQEDYTTWTATATNTAGSQLLSRGSEIIGVASSEGQNFIWTDVDLHSMQFIGPPYTFGFQQIGTNCGLIGPNAKTIYNNVAFWMGNGNFFMFQGGVQVIPCTVLHHVFDSINLTQRNKIFCALNSEFHEVTWFYCSSGSDDIDKYVTLNVTEQVWYTGSMDRTAWIDRGIIENPLASNKSAQIYIHESGTDDDTSAMTAYLESSDFDIGEGDQLMFVKQIVPDFDNLVGTVDVTFKTRYYSQSSQVTETAHTVSSSTAQIPTRMRGRQMAMRIESDAKSDNWRYGSSRINMRTDGRQ